MKSAAIAAVVAAITAAGVTSWLNPLGTEAPYDSLPDLSQPDVLVIPSFDVQEALRSQQAQIDELTRTVATLERLFPGQVEGTDSEGTTESLTVSSTQAAPAQRFRTPEARKLIEAGLGETEAHAVTKVVGDVNESRLREGADSSPSIRDVLTAEFGDQVYDAYLYATGQTNRLVVSSMSTTSPARDAGIQSGDTVYSLDGRRVYSYQDLQMATSSAASDWVELKVQRNGELVDAYIQKDSLGFRMERRRVNPAE